MDDRKQRIRAAYGDYFEPKPFRDRRGDQLALELIDEPVPVAQIVNEVMLEIMADVFAVTRSEPGEGGADG